MGSRGNNGGGLQAIPEASRKIVRSLKEVVGGCPEAEIYAMLKDCNMDPNEAVNRLLSQDPFHEVKSKREKKKENKYTTESKTRRTNNQSSRGSRGGSDHYVGRGGAQFSSSESGASHVKPTYKKENGSAVYGNHSSVSSGATGNNVYRQPPVYSDFVSENKATTMDMVAGGWGSLPSSGFPQPSGNQPAWGGVPGQVSMADIVKMGRPQAKASSSANQSQSGACPPQSNSSYCDVNTSEVSLSKVSPNDEWPLVEPSARISPAVQSASDWHTDTSHRSCNIIDQHPEPEHEQAPAMEDASVENISANHDGYASVSGGRIQNDNSEVASPFNSDVYENIESYRPHGNAFEHQEEIGDPVSSVTSNLQQLKVVDEREAPSEEEEDAAVIIPNHLQVVTSDCLHLSFGSFRFLGADPDSSLPSTNSNIEEASAEEDAPSVGHLDARNSEYFGDKSLRAGSDGNVVHGTGTSATGYDPPSVSQLEVLTHENHDGSPENQYAFPSSNYGFENGPQLNASFPSSQTSAQMQTFSNAYSNSLPSSLLGTGSQSVRESDYSYSPFAMGQSIPAKYGSTVSSVSSSTVSMPEVLKAACFSSTVQTPQNLTGSNIATAPALPQHLMHQYSQMGPFANLIGYHPPFLPQSYYLPSAYQQAFAGNNAYHHSLGAVLPQYKNSISVSSLPQSAAIVSGYGGGFGSSTSLPGNFPTNQPSGPGTTAVGYEDVLSSQYKDASHLLSLQQNENQAMWAQGPGSKTMSGIPANTYYSYQGHSQQQQQQPPSGFRQNQQLPSQNYGALGNSNFYHSQSGVLLDHQQLQNPRDGPLVGSQVQGNNQSQQLWQNSY